MLTIGLYLRRNSVILCASAEIFVIHSLISCTAERERTDSKRGGGKKDIERGVGVK